MEFMTQEEKYLADDTLSITVTRTCRKNIITNQVLFIITGTEEKMLEHEPYYIINLEKEHHFQEYS